MVNALPTPRNCETCQFFKWIEGKKGECRHSPPTPFMLALPSPPTVLGTNRAGLQVQFMSSFPPVQKNHWCGSHDWKLRAAMDQADGEGPEAEPSGC